jgi:hypothetical protein
LTEHRPALPDLSRMSHEHYRQPIQDCHTQAYSIGRHMPSGTLRTLAMASHSLLGGADGERRATIDVTLLRSSLALHTPLSPAHAPSHSCRLCSLQSHPIPPTPREHIHAVSSTHMPYAEFVIGVAPHEDARGVPAKEENPPQRTAGPRNAYAPCCSAAGF